MGKKNSNKITRRDTLKALATIPVLGAFGYAYKSKLDYLAAKSEADQLSRLKIDKINALGEKLVPPSGDGEKTIRFGLVGNGWRGEQLLRSLGYIHPEQANENTDKDKYSRSIKEFLKQENLNVEFAAVCDTFEVHTKRGVEISSNNFHPGGKKSKLKEAKVYSSYRDMIKSDEIDAIIIATADHSHATIAIEAAKAGKHVYLEKPMTHTIEEAVQLRDTIKSTGVAFQLGHENRQQMSFKVAHELYRKGAFGDVSMVQVYTNRNTIFGAWIRDDAFDHRLGNKDNIDWEEFLCNAPKQEFDYSKYFSWQRYNDFGTNMTGNNFTHQYDCINQVLRLGIPESVVASGGQYYYKHHGDMPDVMSAVFNYPERNLVMTYNGNLKNDAYQPTRILGSDCTVDIDRAVLMMKNNNSERYKDVKIEPSDPLFYYEPKENLDAVTSATSLVYMKGGYGPTYIDGKMIDATLLHLKEWLDTIRGKTKTSCNIDEGFDESVTFNLANLAYNSKKTVYWDKVNEEAVIG